MNDDIYHHMVTERHRIWTARQKNLPQPWTTDPILSNRKFTNMFRVLDPGSQFVFELDCDDPVDVMARLVFYRLTNLPKTWYAMRNILCGRWPVAKDFTHEPDHNVLQSGLKAYRDAGNTVFSGAYIIVPEPGTANDKIEGAMRVTKTFVENHMADFLSARRTADQFAVLRSVPGLGPFLSMQILTDWGYVQQTPPYLSFVVAGPGARRGAAILDNTRSPEDVIATLASRWVDHPVVQLSGRSLTPMDVQNTLCEFGKYVREMGNPRKKTPYRPANPGPQLPPIVPQWW